MGLRAVGTLLVAAELLRRARLRLLRLRSPLWILRRVAPPPSLAALVNQIIFADQEVIPGRCRRHPFLALPGGMGAAGCRFILGGPACLRARPYLCPQRIAAQQQTFWDTGWAALLVAALILMLLAAAVVAGKLA